MSVPPISQRRWTADDVRALPDEPGKRFECVDGELLVSPSPPLPHPLPHQLMLGALWRALDAYVHRELIGAVIMAPSDLELDAFTLVQPDLFVLPLVEGRPPRTKAEIGFPLLVIEVLSPSTAHYDRVLKRDRYQRYGVENWIVDLDARLLERWTPESDRPEILTESITWCPTGASSALALELTPLFDEALGPL